MNDIIISLFSDGSLMDVATVHESIMELLPTCYAVEFNGKTYCIDDEYYMKCMENAKELNIKLLVFDNEVHVEEVDI